MFTYNCFSTSSLWCEDTLDQQGNDTIKDVDVLDAAQSDFHAGMAASVFVTVMSELGDKSFFMSAILAMHHSRTLTFLGSILGQIIMTGVAVTLGMAASLVPEVYTKWVSCICMTFFGLKMLKEGFGMPLEEEEESCFDQNDNLKELDEKVSEKLKQQMKGEILTEDEEKVQSYKISTTDGLTDKCNSKHSSNSGSRRGSSQGVLMQAFTMSCLGEWGDRSQIATILLASNENPYGVAVGSIFGHIVCSLTAVVGGRIIGQKFPVKTMTQVGGVVFLLCAASGLILE